MWLLAQLFEELPEAGDLDKPKLAFFFDEAHLLFEGATEAFLDAVTNRAPDPVQGRRRLLHHPAPKDVPAEVFGQLGNRVQHALRAFTPEDAKALKATVSTFPKTDYDLETLTCRHRRGGHHRHEREGRPDAGGALPACAPPNPSWVPAPTP